MRALSRRIAAMEASRPGDVSDALDKAFRAVFNGLWSALEGRGADGISALAERIRAGTMTDADRRILSALPPDALVVVGQTAAEYVAELSAVIESGKV